MIVPTPADLLAAVSLYSREARRARGCTCFAAADAEGRTDLHALWCGEVRPDDVAVLLATAREQTHNDRDHADADLRTGYAARLGVEHDRDAPPGWEALISAARAEGAAEERARCVARFDAYPRVPWAPLVLFEDAIRRIITGNEHAAERGEEE